MGEQAKDKKNNPAETGKGQSPGLTKSRCLKVQRKGIWGKVNNINGKAT